MNELNRGALLPRRVMPRPHRACLLLLTPAALLSACSNPLFPAPEDYGPVTPTERLRSVATLKLEDNALPKVEPKALTEPPPDIFEGMEHVDVTIEQARAWTLENNLDLQVALINPTIEREGLSEEEARFEWLFTSRVRYNNIDSPTSSTLAANQSESLDVIPGVQIPLRTGGTATIELPVNRSETNNQFTFLNPSYTSDAVLSISQPLLRNAGRRASTYQIRLQALESQIAESRAKLEVIRQLANVDRAYWRLYAAQRLLEVRQEQYELAKTQLAQAERRVRAQVAPEVEVIRAQSGLAERLEAIIIAQNAVRDVQRDLKRIMNQQGLAIGDPRIVRTSTVPDPVEYELEPEAFAAQAVANRMEMLELELRLAQDYSTIDFQKNQALPLFTMDYRYGINGLGSSLGDSLETLRDNNFEDWSLGANLEIPLGNEAGESRVHQAILRRLQRLASKEGRELSIRQEVYNAVDNLYAGWQRILASRQAAILAARTLRAEQNQFEVGARTSTDVLDAATRLADAQSAEIRALTEYQISQVDLAFATGTLLGSARVDWQPRDPRGPKDFVGERRGRVPMGPPGNSKAALPQRLRVPEPATTPNAEPAAQPADAPAPVQPDPQP